MTDRGSVEPTDPLLGVVVGGYRVSGVLGSGGMGRVYLARGGGQQVALKLVHAELASDAVFRKRFAREARIAQQVKSPHVVPVIETGEHEGVPFMAQRLIVGESLERRLKRDGQLDLTTTLDICSQVALGLDALHAAGMIHRDVKPGNVLLEKGGTVYITDFGLAKDRQGTQYTSLGQALGSLDYMAPEIFDNAELTPAADVYALGCMIIECLTGSAPFAHRLGMHVALAHMTEQPKLELPDAPAEVAPAVLRALAKQASDRPQSATAFVRSVRRAAGLTD
jgi:serine/threonine protein kinase